MFRQEEKERQELDEAAKKQATNFGYTKSLVPTDPKGGQSVKPAAQSGAQSGGRPRRRVAASEIAPCYPDTPS